jgi:hypothetical protein
MCVHKKGHCSRDDSSPMEQWPHITAEMRKAAARLILPVFCQQILDLVIGIQKITDGGIVV